MVTPAIKEQILQDLDRLTPEQQERAAQLGHSLVEAPNKGTSGHDLLRFASSVDAEAAREKIAAIEDGCERVNPDEW